MNRKSKLKINKGEEFKIAIKNINDGDTIFYDQYKQALKMLDDIIEASIKENKNTDRDAEWKTEDYENNIIAFCGERGEGKSSAMFTFINSLNSLDEKILNDAGLENRKVKEVYFERPIVIDPSQFDGVHNILDIILAKLYEKFSYIYMDDKYNIDEYLKEELLHQFQKVYRQVSMISNKAKMLDDEFDYEGNIGKLSKLGESTRLKKGFRRLLELYLEFMDKSRNEKSKNQQIIIAIDDLDLCSSNAYKMSEQIRKYLILPQVVIIMAVKIEQLELCVQENNLSDFEKSIKVSGKDNIKIYNEVIGMAERYVSKLIPKARRIYLPKAQSLENTDIIYVYKDKDEEIGISDDIEERSLVEKVLKLITEKTGMIFLPEESGISYLLPNNLRDMVNWIVCLSSMETPDGEDNIIYAENIQKFYQLFEMEILDAEKFDNMGNKLKSIWKMDIVHTHANVKKLLDEIKSGPVSTRKIIPCGERTVEFFQVMKKFEFLKREVFEYEDERKIYAVRSLYTIRMNQLKAKGKLFDVKGFVNGYIFGDRFKNIMPKVKLNNNDLFSRDRFNVKTARLYNELLHEISENLLPHELEFSEDGVVRVKNIIEKDEEKLILVWILIGLFCNVTSIEKKDSKTSNKIYKNDQSIIYNNRNLMKEVEVSIENYIVNLCNINNIYNKMNMEMLGVKRDKFDEIVGDIKNRNKEIIKCMEKIVANVDIALEIYQYWKENNDYKEATDSKLNRSKEIVNTFLKNIYNYFLKRNIKIECMKDKFTQLDLGKDTIIDVGKVYARLIECGIEFNQEQDVNLTNEKYRDLRDEFNDILLGLDPRYTGEKEYKFSSYLKKTTAENARKNLEKMAGNIIYLSGHRLYSKYETNITLLENNIEKLYSEVLSVYIKNPYEKLKEKIVQNYSKLAGEEKDLLKKMNEEM